MPAFVVTVVEDFHVQHDRDADLFRADDGLLLRQRNVRERLCYRLLRTQDFVFRIGMSRTARTLTRSVHFRSVWWSRHGVLRRQRKRAIDGFVDRGVPGLWKSAHDRTIDSDAAVVHHDVLPGDSNQSLRNVYVGHDHRHGATAAGQTGETRKMMEAAAE